MNAIQAQLNILSLATNNQTRSKRKYYCWSCGSNYTYESKTCSTKKEGHQEEAYYNKRLGGSKKGCELRLGGEINKIEMSHPKISLIICIRTPPNYPSNNMLTIADSGANIHLEKQSTTKIAPLIMSN